MSGLRSLAAAAIAGLLALAWLVPSGGPAAALQPGGEVRGLPLVAHPVSPLGVNGYATSGSFFQVGSVGTARGFTTVNRALAAGVASWEQRTVFPFAQSGPAPTATTTGRLEMLATAALASASTKVVSALEYVTLARPGGALSDRWYGETFRVTGGRPVAITTLLPTRAGLEALAGQLRQGIQVSGLCFATTPGRTAAHFLAPLPANFASFALTAQGLVVGFGAGTVATLKCGPVEVAVAYRTLRSQLSKSGKALVASVRAPPSWSVLPGAITGTTPAARPGPTDASGLPGVCPPSQLQLTVGGQWMVHGHQEIVVVLRNTGTTACQLSGYPSVGTEAPDTVRARPTGRGFFNAVPTGTPPPIVVLGPQEEASSLIESIDATAAGGGGCAPQRALEVIVPTGSTSQVLFVAMTVCPTIEVHPVVPGPTGNEGVFNRN